MQHFAVNQDPRDIQKVLGQKRRSRSSSIDPGHARKETKANQDQTSVRSHSPDIADDINREIAETGMRLANMANSSNPDTSMDPATMSLNRDTESQRSQSSEGSLNKRTMKSNIALQNKKSAIQKLQADLDAEEDGDDQIEDEPSSGSKATSTKSQMVSDDMASEIFDKLTKLQGKKTYYAKQNWTDDESKLLLWAIQKYCSGKNIIPQKLDKNDWIQVAGFIPGRNDSQCQYKFNQDKKSTIKKSNWVRREDEELVKLIRENGTKQWSQISNRLNENLNVQRNGKQCRERWVNFLNPEIKKDPFTLQEDILILEKRLSIGNKWSEIIKDMPGRTENNVKNRFNMMFKNIKDEHIKNRNHQSVFVMKEKCGQDSDVAEDQINEEQLIKQLIHKKKKEIAEKEDSQVPEKSSTTPTSSAKGKENFKFNQPSGAVTPQQDMDDLLSNNLMQESSHHTQTMIDQTMGKQKEFLKLGSTCQNKEKINHAIEKLIEFCPGQINVIKRLVEYIQEDINRMIRLSAAYASNTSMGSTNNIMGTSNANPSLFHNNRANSSNAVTLDQLSNRSPGHSPITDVQDRNGRAPYHQNQIIIGKGGQIVQPVDILDGKRSSSLINGANQALSKTPGAPSMDQNKTPMAMTSQLFRLPDGRLIQAASQINGQQSQYTPGRSLTPSQMNGQSNNGYTPSSGGRINRSMSPIGNEIPGEKKFVEVNTKEQLIISTIGIYASKKDEDRYVPLQNPQQILFAPFEQLLRKYVAAPGENMRQIVNKKSGESNIGNIVMSNTSNQSPSPLQGFGKATVSPSQFLSSIPKQDAHQPQQIVQLNAGQIFQQPNGQIYIVQPAAQGGRASNSPNNAQNQYQIQNPMNLINYGVAGPTTAQNYQSIISSGLNQNQNINQYYSNTSVNNGANNGMIVGAKGLQTFAAPAQQIGLQNTSNLSQSQNQSNLHSNLSALDSKLASSNNNVSMIVSDMSGYSGNISGNNPISGKGMVGAPPSQLPQQPQLPFPLMKQMNNQNNQDGK